MITEKDIFFDYVMENCRDIIFVNDMDYKFLNCNRTFLKLFKLSHKSEVITKTLDDIFPLEIYEYIKNKFNEVLLNREPKTFSYHIGKNVFKQTSTPVIENCEIIGILSVVHDITIEEELKLKLMEKICQLNSYIDMEKNLKVQKEMFMATLTHDLKNPVQALLMTLKLFRAGTFGELKPQQSEILNNVIDSANYMQNMLYSILTTYKFENGIIELKKTTQDPNGLIKSCINEINAMASDKNIKIVYETNINNKNLFADFAQLRRVIGNLLNNALNYSYKNSEIKIELSIKNENMIFSFTNTGDKIPKDFQKHIFEKFASSGKQLTNTGLGLYFSKKVIEAHNGKIYLNCNGNKNTFVFEIPLNNTQEKSAVKW